MLRIVAWAGVVLTSALCITASAQFGEDDPRFELDPRDEETDPRDTEDGLLADVRDFEATQVENLKVHELFDTLYERDNREALYIALSEHRWELLGYLDALCERWHNLVDDGALADPARRIEADALRERCADMARLCDEAAVETTFFLYTDRQFSWDKEQRVAFREGQAEFARAVRLVDSAVEPEDLNQALGPCQRAYDTARILGNTRGQTLAISLSAQIHAANGDLAGAASAMDEGLRLGRLIHDLDTVWLALTMRYAAAMEATDWQLAEETLTEQHNLAVEVGDSKTAGQLLNRIIQLIDYRRVMGL